LVDEVFAGKFTFRHAGLSPVEVEAEQLRGAAGTVLLGVPRGRFFWHKKSQKNRPRGTLLIVNSILYFFLWKYLKAALNADMKKGPGLAPILSTKS